MRTFNRFIPTAVAAAALLGGLGHAASALATQMSADGWQQLRPTSANKAKRDLALLASVPVTAPTAIAAASPQASVPAPVAGVGPAVEEAFRLVKGEPLQLQLQQWAARAGWTVVWNVPDGWIVPGDKTYGTDFEVAVQRAVEELASNGADVVGDSWRGNRTVIISQNGVFQ